MSRDRYSFFAYNLSGKHFNPTSCGVIRNQRSKIRRSNITSTARCHFRKTSKFECRVIKHARINSLNFSIAKLAQLIIVFIRLLAKLDSLTNELISTLVIFIIAESQFKLDSVRLS